MDKIHDLALVYAKVMFEKHVNSPKFIEKDVEENLLALKGFYDFAHNQLKYLEQTKND